MKRFVIPTALIALGIMLVILTATVVQAASYELPRWVISGGGGFLAGGNYTLNGTIGQPVAGSIGGGNYSLTSGFWWEVLSPNFWQFLPWTGR